MADQNGGFLCIGVLFVVLNVPVSETSARIFRVRNGHFPERGVFNSVLTLTLRTPSVTPNIPILMKQSKNHVLNIEY